MKKILLLLVMLLLGPFLVSGAGWPDNFCTDVRVHFSMDNNNSIGQVNSTATNNGTTTVVGKIGYAQDFESTNTNFMNWGDHNAYTFSNISFSLSYWIKQESAAAVQATPVGKMNLAASTTYEYYTYISNAGLSRLYMWDTGADYIANGGGTVASAVWEFHLFTYFNGTTTSHITFYKNGTNSSGSVDSAGTFSGMQNTAAPLVFGARNNGATYDTHYDGLLDEVTLYNTTLSAANITYLYNSSNGVNLTQLCFTTPPITTQTIFTARDNISGASISNFQLTILRENATVFNYSDLLSYLHPTNLTETNTTIRNFTQDIANASRKFEKRNGAVYQESGGQGRYQFDGVDSYLNITGPILGLTQLNNFSMCTVSSVNDTLKSDGESQDIISRLMGSNANSREAAMVYNIPTSANELQFRLRIGSTGTTLRYANPQNNTAYCTCGTYDGNNASFYVQGNLANSSIIGGPWTQNGTVSTILGSRDTGQAFLNGSIYFASVFNRSLTAAEVRNLCATWNQTTVWAEGGDFSTTTGSITFSNGALNANYHLNYSSAGYRPTNYRAFLFNGLTFQGNLTPFFLLSFNASDLYNNASIQTLTVNISNSTFSIQNTSSTGNVTFADLEISGLFNVTFSDPQYFNRTINVTFNTTAGYITATLFQTILTLEAYKTISNEQILIFNSSLPLEKNVTINGTGTLRPSGGTYTLAAVSPSLWPIAQAFTITNLSQIYMRLNFSTSQINVTARFFSTPITAFNVTYTRTDTDYAYSVTVSTTTGTTQAYLLNGTYNLSIDAPGFTTATALVTVGFFYQYNFTLFEQTVLNITFRDAISKNIITYANITIDFISAIQSATYTTSNGTLYIALLAPASYLLRYSAPGYPLQFNQFTIVNRTFQNLTLYMLNNTYSDNITVNVIDENTLPVGGALVITLRYDLASNSYLEQESAYTNSQGQTQFSMQLNGEFYKFLIYYNGRLALISEPDQIRDTELTFQIVIGETATQQFQQYLNVAFNLSFNNDTRNFGFTYSDITNTLTGACLYVSTVTLLGKTAFNSTCVNSSAATILLGAPRNNGTTYLAEAYILFPGDTQYTFIANLMHSDPLGDTFEDNYIYLLYLFFVLFVMMARFSLLFPLLLGPMPMVIFSILDWIPLQPWAAFTIYAVCITVAVIIMKRM